MFVITYWPVLLAVGMQDDPSVNKLQAYAAKLFGMEDALFCPSGTMSNQIAIKVGCFLQGVTLAITTFAFLLLLLLAVVDVLQGQFLPGDPPQPFASFLVAPHLTLSLAQVHTHPGDELICADSAHVFCYEGGGIAFNSGGVLDM